MGAVRLMPGAFVELDDPIVGGRKLGYVDETGMGYFDLHGEGQLPKALNEELHPVELGSIGSWLVNLPDQQREQLADAWKVMADSNSDQLTIARAIRWGLVHGADDLATLMRMGEYSTEQVRTGVSIVESTFSG